jgi:hypothetical protein
LQEVCKILLILKGGQEIMRNKKSLLIFLILIFLTNSVYANLTLEDYKEIRKIVREEVDVVRREMNNRIDDMKSFMLTGFVIIFTGIFTLLGFVIWDRRTAISPVVKKSKELEEKSDLTLKILKEYSKKEPKLAAILKSFNIL